MGFSIQFYVFGFSRSNGLIINYIPFFYLLQQNCGNYGFRGNGEDYDYIHVNKPVVAAELAGRIGEGFSDVLCGNGNLCGRDTPGPGICCKFHF